MASKCHVQRNLSALKDLPRVTSCNIKDFPEAFKTHRRLGRGPGSKRGKTSGRGHKGQSQRGLGPYFQFEGGQTPFYRLVPKHGHRKSALKQKHYAALNLDKLQYFIDSKRIDPNQTITMKVLKDSGAVSGKIVDGIKLLGNGADWFAAKVNIEVSLASQNAINAVERQGGEITTVYFNQLGMRLHLNPERFKPPIPRLARPTDKLLKVYADPAKRGFLANSEEKERLRAQNISRMDLVCKEIQNLKVK
eukprot:gene4913-5560_t